MKPSPPSLPPSLPPPRPPARPPSVPDPVRALREEREHVGHKVLEPQPGDVTLVWFGQVGHAGEVLGKEGGREGSENGRGRNANLVLVRLFDIDVCHQTNHSLIFYYSFTPYPAC